MSDSSELPPPVDGSARERDIRMECLRLATGFANLDTVELAKNFVEFVLGPPAAVESAAKPRRKRKPLSAERREQLMQQLVTARARRKAKAAEREAA